MPQQAWHTTHRRWLVVVQQRCEPHSSLAMTCRLAQVQQAPNAQQATRLADVDDVRRGAATHDTVLLAHHIRYLTQWCYCQLLCATAAHRSTLSPRPSSSLARLTYTHTERERETDRHTHTHTHTHTTPHKIFVQLVNIDVTVNRNKHTHRYARATHARQPACIADQVNGVGRQAPTTRVRV